MTDDIVDRLDALVKSYTRELSRFGVYGESADKTIGLAIDEIESLRRERDRLRAAMQWFVDRVDKGEVRRSRAYAQFKKLLGETE